MKKILSVLLTIALLFTMLALCVSADPTPAGTGISTQDELSQMDPLGTYYLEENIVIHGDWKYTEPFKGVLNGNGKTIYFDHAKVTGGLFTIISGGNTANPVKISNLTIVELEDVEFVPFFEGSKTSAIGVLAAQVSQGTVEITNVSAYAKITVDEGTYQNTNDYDEANSGIVMGGIVGEARFTTSLKFERCIFMGSLTNEKEHITGSVNSRSSMGGILGSTWGNKSYIGSIPASKGKVLTLSFTECINYGDLTANTRLGGMIGYTYSESYWSVGTFIMERCINYGDMKSEYLDVDESGVGGLFGRRMNFLEETSTIVSNINYGTITGNKKTNRGGIGGLLQASTDGTENNPYEMNLENFVLRGNVNYGDIVTVGSSTESGKIASIFGCFRTTTGASIIDNNIRIGENYHSDNLDDIALPDTMGYGHTTEKRQKEAFSGTNIDYADEVLDALNEMYPGVYVGLNFDDGDDENDLIVLKWAQEAGYNEGYADSFVAAIPPLSEIEPDASAEAAPQTMTLSVSVPAATGTAISNQAELEAMQPNGTYYLTADIAITGQYLPTFNAFKGVLHGNGHAIVFKEAKKVQGGLLGSVAGAKIYNLTITEEGSENEFFPMSYAGSNCLGMLAAYGYGTFVNVTVKCKVSNSTMRYSAGGCVGGLIGILTEGDSVLYNCRNLNKVIGCYAGGIVGRVWAGKNKVEICRCANWGEITSYIGYAGGIVAYHDASTQRLLVSENVNYGKVEAVGENDDINAGPVMAGNAAYCGGIFGWHKNVWGGSAYFLRNANYGTVVSEATNKSNQDIGYPGGILGYLNARNAKGTIVSGNINYGTVDGNNAPNQLIAVTEKIDGNSVVENNFAAEGTVPATVGTINGIVIDADTLETLNAAYPDAFAAGTKIALKWAADAGLSAKAPAVTYELPEPEPEPETPAPAPATETPATTTETTTKKKKGCGSTVGIGGAVALVAILGAGTAAVARRKED